MLHKKHPQKEHPSSEKKVRPMALTVKAAVIRNGDEVLLLRRAKHCLNGGKWDLPGGHVDEGETVFEALEREIREETNIAVQVGPIIRLSEFPKGHEQFKNEKRGLRYIAFYQAGEVHLREQEHDTFEWLKIDEAITRLEDEGFEREKKDTLVEAKRYLEMNQALDGWKRALADLDNYRKRMQKSNEEFRKYCTEDFILELLPVIDNFDIAAEHIPAEMAKDNWVTGLMHIKSQLEAVLRGRGIEPIATQPGDPIDVNVHEVLQGGEGKEHVKKVIKKGYRMGDRVIRPVMVETE